MRLVAAILIATVAAALALPAGGDDAVSDQIVAAYQKSLDALARGDAEAALEMDTDDWTSTIAGQAPRSKAEIAFYIRRDIAGMKPPPGWKAAWQPDYEHKGTLSGIQVYSLTVDGKTGTRSAIVLCLVGNTQEQRIDGKPHTVWIGSHVRDTWTETANGWKRRQHEKLTVNEKMIDGKPAQ